MAFDNALDDPPLTPSETEAEEEEKPTDTEPEGEPQPVKTATEPPAGSKSWEHALQQSREREKREREQRQQLEQQMQETQQKLRDYELEGLSESERYRVEADEAKAETARLKEQIQVEEVKKEYRRYLAEKEVEFPKTAGFLKKQADKDIYPVQGQTSEEFEENFTSFAQDYEGIPTATEPKPSVTNPEYTPPEEVDLSTLSAKEMRKILPIAEK